MRWTEDMSVGVPMIDNRHKELINRLNGLRTAIKNQVCRYTIADMLAFLDEYVEVHFFEEEQYMKYYGYSDYALHKERHKDFVTELYFLKEELRNIRSLELKGSYELSVETVQIVVDWVVGHVANDDHKLGNFLKQQSNMNHDFISSLCGSEEHIIMGIVTICSICHKIRGRKGLWKQKENYKEIPSDIVYSHGICPECLQIYYADLFQDKR
jgi:hemerythrin